MSSPEHSADAPSDYPETVGDLRPGHVGWTIAVQGTTGVLVEVPTGVAPGKVGLVIQQEGQTFRSAITASPSQTIMAGAPVSPVDDDPQVPEHVRVARELAQVSDMITSREGEIDELKSRYAELADKIMDYYELAGDTQLSVDNRLVYLSPYTYPAYRERPASEGGGKYTDKDVMAALRKLGREANIKPETVNSQTLGAILREYRDDDKPVPPELDMLVELAEKPRVKVGKPGRKRR